MFLNRGSVMLDLCSVHSLELIPGGRDCIVLDLIFMKHFSKQEKHFLFTLSFPLIMKEKKTRN